MTGPELKARRKELELTMQDVADRVGLVHRQQVYEWERGKVRPGRKHLRRSALSPAHKRAHDLDQRRLVYQWHGTRSIATMT